MTFTLPAVKDPCDLGRGSGKWIADINTPSNTGTKAAGSLPITGVATEFDNNSAGSTKGYAREFETGQTPVYDVSTDTKIMLWHSQHNAPNRIQTDTVANGGLIIRIYSGTGSPPTVYRDFYVGGNDTPQSECIKGQYPLVIDLNDVSHDASSGTFDNTAVTSVAVLITRFNLAGSSTSWNYQGKLYILDTTKTSADTPTFTGASDLLDAVVLLQGTDYTDKLGNWVRRIGSVVFMDMPFRIGDNSTSTQFNDNGLSLVSPVANDSGDPRVRVTTQAFRTYLNLRNNAADTAEFSGTWLWGTRAAFDWDQDDAAVVTFSSPTFKGMGRFTLGSSITGPATFDDVDEVVFADTGVDIDGSVIKNPNGTYALEMAGAMDISDIRFEGYGSKHAILIPSAGVYNLTNVFFDQSGTNDIETTHASGVVTINVLGSTTVPTVTITGAGTVNVVVNADYTINGIENLTEITILDRDVSMLGITGTAANQNLGDVAANTRVGQSFQVTAAGKVERIRLNLRKVGTPTDGLRVRVTNGIPGSSELLVSTYIDGADLTTSYVEFDVDLDGKSTLSLATTYGIEIERSGANDGSNYYQVEYSTTSVHASGARYLYNASWVSQTGDLLLSVMEAASDNELYTVASVTTGTTTWTHDGTIRNIEVLAMSLNFLALVYLDDVTAVDKSQAVSQIPDLIYSNP